MSKKRRVDTDVNNSTSTSSEDSHALTIPNSLSSSNLSSLYSSPHIGGGEQLGSGLSSSNLSSLYLSNNSSNFSSSDQGAHGTNNVLKLEANSPTLMELIKLAESDATKDSQEVRNSAFYKAVQTATHLMASNMNVDIDILMFIAKIATTSPTLHTIDFSKNQLGANSIEVINELGAVNLLHTLDISDNNLAGSVKEGLTKAFSTLTSLHALNISNNGLEEHVKELAKGLAPLNTLYNVTGVQGLEEAIALAKLAHTTNQEDNIQNLGNTDFISLSSTPTPSTSSSSSSFDSNSSSLLSLSTSTGGGDHLGSGLSLTTSRPYNSTSSSSNLSSSSTSSSSSSEFPLFNLLLSSYPECPSSPQYESEEEYQFAYTAAGARRKLVFNGDNGSDTPMYQELLNLAESNADINSPAVTDSEFYKAMRKVEVLEISEQVDYGDDSLPSSGFLLIAKIAAISPKLHTIVFGSNYESIVGAIGSELALILSSSCSLREVSLWGNDIGNHAPETAINLVRSSTIQKVNMLSNELDKDSYEKTKAVFDNHNEYVKAVKQFIELEGLLSLLQPIPASMPVCLVNLISQYLVEPTIEYELNYQGEVDGITEDLT